MNLWTWPKNMVCLERRNKTKQNSKNLQINRTILERSAHQRPTAISISMRTWKMSRNMLACDDGSMWSKRCNKYGWNLFVPYRLLKFHVFSLLCLNKCRSRALANNNECVADWCDDMLCYATTTFFSPDVHTSLNNVYAPPPRSYHYTECRNIMKEQKEE